MDNKNNNKRNLETELTLSDGARVRIVGDYVRGCHGAGDKGCGAIEVVDENGKKGLIPQSEYDLKYLHSKGHSLSHTLLSEDCAERQLNGDEGFSESEINELVRDFGIEYSRCPESDEPILYHQQYP